MNMTTTINIEELYNFLDRIQESINKIKETSAIGQSAFEVGYAAGHIRALADLDLISFSQYEYLMGCINSRKDIDPDTLGNFDNFKDGE